MGIMCPLVLVFFTCLLIWRACDGFETASEYIGRDLSEGVRGGTINAISSSLPELFTTLIALFILADRDGFAVGLGTTAGSALFNGMIIPAACIFAVVGRGAVGVRVDSVNVSTKVVLRDGLTLIFCEVVLIYVINRAVLDWWQGLILMLLYIGYLAYMLLSMKSVDQGVVVEDQRGDSDNDEAVGKIAHCFYWLSGGPLLDLERFFVGEKQRIQIREQQWNGWPLLFASAGVIGAACWLLVTACEWLGTGAGNVQHPHYHLFGHELQGLGMPTMFVAVIFASMATSVPDTIISVRDAQDGDSDDAVANALGSNIFDICFALGFPLFLFTLIDGPIELTEAVRRQSTELVTLLLLLTIIGFAIYFSGKRGTTEAGTQYVEMRRGKACLLLLLYCFFVAYIVGCSMNATWAHQVSIGIQAMLRLIS